MPQPNNPDKPTSSKHLSVPVISRAPSPVTSSPHTTLQHSRIHPVIEAQTEHFNKTALGTDNTDTVADKTPDTMSSYSSPGDYAYRTIGPRETVSITEINQMRQTLKHRRVNTLTELRRIERVLSSLPGFMAEYMNEMTDSWGYYVSSNNLLSELRGLTRQYPFSTELLEDAKVRVYNDANSSRSWNFAWLLLAKIKTDHMIPEYATSTAHQPAMWGGVVPDHRHAAELTSVLVGEWSRAVDQLLKHWPNPPTVNGAW